MGKPEWGRKWTCHHCDTRFYDMKRGSPICPNCGTEAVPPGSPRSRTARAAQAAGPREAAEAETLAAEADDIGEGIGDGIGIGEGV